jgi:hypothetical protein
VFITGEKWKPFKYRDYKEWKREPDKEQDDEAESRWREFKSDPYNKVLDFDGLNQKGRKALFPKLQEFLMNFLKYTNVMEEWKSILKYILP